MSGDQVARPPVAVLQWLVDATGGVVTRVRPLMGGMTSAVHQVGLRYPGGDTRQVVVRRYVHRWVLDEVPDIVDRERRALRLLEPVGLSTPRELAVDAEAAATDVPAVLMTRVPGRPMPPPADMEDWLHRLARVLPVLHATPLPVGHGIGDFHPYPPERFDPPPWMAHPEVWERAVSMFQRPVDEPNVFIHRDFHTGNVLWRRGRVSGVVDWQVASVGPPSVDVGWCRLNLLREHGPDAATRFTAAWEACSGARYHPVAEVLSLVDMLGSTHATPPPHAAAFEELLAKAVAELR